MERFLKDNDLVTINDNIKIIVLKAFTHNNQDLAYCQDVTNFDVNNPQYLMIREIIQDNNPQVEILTNVQEIESALQTLQALTTN